MPGRLKNDLFGYLSGYYSVRLTVIFFSVISECRIPFLKLYIFKSKYIKRILILHVKVTE